MYINIQKMSDENKLIKEALIKEAFYKLIDSNNTLIGNKNNFECVLEVGDNDNFKSVNIILKDEYEYLNIIFKYVFLIKYNNSFSSVVNNLNLQIQTLAKIKIEVDECAELENKYTELENK